MNAEEIAGRFYRCLGCDKQWEFPLEGPGPPRPCDACGADNFAATYLMGDEVNPRLQQKKVCSKCGEQMNV